MSSEDASESIGRAAKLYRRGIFCPAELWNRVTDRLTADDAERVLAALPEEHQAILRAAYVERPWSLRPGTRDNEIRRAVEHWCLGDGP